VGGLARILRYMPDDWPTRGQYEALFRMMCERLRRLQMDSGGWASSLAYPEKFDNETEASGTAFFIYAIAWGINSGLLDRPRYGPVVEKGWAELCSCLNADGSIRNIQVVGQKPGAYEGGYDKREYGYGAFIMAGVQMAEYYSEATDPTSWSGYPVVADNGQLWVDTEGFLGWLELSHRPWQYVLSLQNWAWIEETDAIQEQGSWVYLIKP
jgi:hypothetical protein